MLQYVRGRRFRRFLLQGQMHPLVPTVLLRMARLDPLDLNAQSQPPHRELAQVIERRGRREGDAVVGANDARQAEFFEGALEDGEPAKEGAQQISISSPQAALSFVPVDGRQDHAAAGPEGLCHRRSKRTPQQAEVRLGHAGKRASSETDGGARRSKPSALRNSYGVLVTQRCGPSP